MSYIERNYLLHEYGYKDLLKRYMLHVMNHSGVSFLERELNYSPADKDCPLKVREWEELEQIATEILHTSN